MFKPVEGLRKPHVYGPLEGSIGSMLGLYGVDTQCSMIVDVDMVKVAKSGANKILQR